MISWQLVPALRIGLALAAGIACSRLNYIFTNFGITSIALSVIAALLLFWPLPIEKRANFRGWGILLATLVAGLLLGYTSVPKKPSIAGANAKAFIAILERVPSKSTNWYSVDAQITSFRSDSGWTNSNSRARILLPPARVAEEMQIGATYLFNSRLKEVSSASNPHAFDYGAYLKGQGIALQAFAKPVALVGQADDGVILLHKGKSANGLVWLRSWISHRIDLALPTPNEAAVAKALLLGDKSSLSEDTRKNYTRTGAIHVLAVSGLHTGIIASIILGILGFVSWRKEIGWLKLLIFWAALLAYVALTGFSPSVQRSAVMFGILYAGKILRRDTNAFNSLGLSAIVLLAFNPQLLFDLGFQLSYSAVAGILAFYPMLRKYFAAENYWLNAMGELNAISIAATIGTLPLTTFYFHQFPVYFLLSGILAVPLVGLALPFLLGGIAIDSIFAFFGSSAYWAYVPAFLLVWLCNASLEAIADLPNALVSGLWPSSLTTCLAILSIVFFGAALLRRRKRLYWAALMLGLFWSVSITITSIDKLKAKQVLVYSLRDDLIVDAFADGYVKSSADNKGTLSPRSSETLETHRAAMNAALDTNINLLLKDPSSPIKYGLANQLRFAILPSEKQLLAPSAPKVDFVIIPQPKSVIPAQLTAAFPNTSFVLANNIPPWKKQDWEPLTSSIHSLKEEGAFFANRLSDSKSEDDK